MRADDVLEPSLAWQGVFLEARQVCVALILLKPAEAKERHAEGKCEWGMSFDLLDFPGMEDNSYRCRLDGKNSGHVGVLPDPSIHIEMLMAA